MYLTDDIKAAFNAMHEGILFIDEDCRIIFGNTAYLNFLNRESAGSQLAIVGKKLTDIRPGAQLPEVIRTGKPILHAQRRETSEIYFVNMYPIYDRDKVIAGMSVVTFMDDANAFNSEIEAMHSRNRQALSHVNYEASGNATFDNIVAKGRKSAACKAYAEKIADTDFPILLIAESGAGKNTYAQAIHNASARREELFLTVNCATMADKLEVELFGCEPGARTDMPHGSSGLLEIAEKGTVFIDEISEMPLEIQSKLLESLQHGMIRRVGAAYGVYVRPRIIVGSNYDLTGLVADGRFKSELFYLLNTFSVNIPPLRERMEDIPVIVRQTLKREGLKQKKQLDITDEAMDRLMSHDWPGNIRELVNVLEFSLYLTQGDIITVESIPENIGADRKRMESTLQERVKAFEKAEILKALEFYGSDLTGKKAAARAMDISLASLYAKLK